MDLYKKFSVLFVDDDAKVIDSHVPFFKRRFDTVYTAQDGLAGYELYKKYTPDVVITDISMPKMDGLAMVKKIKKIKRDVKVIFFSAKQDKDNLLEAMDLHPLKYFLKPVDHNELINFFDNNKYLFSADGINLKIYLGNGIYFDFEMSAIEREGRTMELTKKESLFLNLLIKNKGNIVTYENIEYLLWDNAIAGENSLKSFVFRLRRKIPGDIIFNKKGIGFRINLND